MTDSLYLRLKCLNTRTVRGVTSPKNIVRVAAMHNLREIQAELGASTASGINPGRMHLNYQLRGPATADGVAALALALLDNAGVTKLRRDACMCVELVFSLPAATAIDHRDYFAAAVAWADAYFSVPVLSAAVHLDEAAPHCHILLLPLIAGRMQGGALAGGPAKIRAMLADFQQQVAQRFGITHQPRAKRLSKLNRDVAGSMVLEALRARPERLQSPGMRDALIAGLGSQAEALLALLGLSMPTTKAKAKSFAEIMTAPCKPERTYRATVNAKPIDIAQNLGNQDGKKFDNVYLCVDVAPSSSPNPAHEQPHQPAEGMQASQCIPAPTAGQAAVGGVLKVQEAPAPDVVRIAGLTHGAVHQLDAPAVDAHHQDGAGDLASHSTQIPGVLGQQDALIFQAIAPRAARHTKPTDCVALAGQQDVSSPARISLECAAAIDETSPTFFVGLVGHHQDGTRHPAAEDVLSFECISPAPGAAHRTPTVNEIRVHKDVSKGGCISKGSSVSRLPAGVLEFWDTPTVSGDQLKTEQVDPQAGRADAHRCSPAGGGHPGPQRGMAPEAREYRRHRDEDHPATSWDEQRGEFAPTTGPPARAKHPHP
ncbi:plasmid recombination protein [Duganella sp. BJB1802]|uniref:plasmid recombination protein n=1 Tax=Duganella sp. BJB1802 TaxID=2744575 RepID=UPI0015939C86|nr:plasmid recombination protein [Duganella sp. BJB1802]NVD74535.1 plasmid recombination protein [Duganella sp. BJB1802]